MKAPLSCFVLAFHSLISLRLGRKQNLQRLTIFFKLKIILLCSFPLFAHSFARRAITTAVGRRFKMTSNTGSCHRTRYGVLVCDNAEKWGGIAGIGKRFIDAFGSNSDLEEWHVFAACEGELPSEKDLGSFNGFFISGSPRSANDNIKWINDLKTFISSSALNSSKARLVGVCFGHQLIGAALGGKVTANPSQKFVLQREEVKTDNDFQGNEAIKKIIGNSDEPLRLLECHGECVAALPPGAQSLAKSATCQHELIQFTENIFGIQAHPEFTVQDYKELLIPELFNAGKIDENGKRLCEESIEKPLDSSKMADALKKFVSKEDN